MPRGTNMPPGALRSSSAPRTTIHGFGSERPKGKGKQRERYTDDSDEEATLLLGHVEGGEDGDPDGDDDGDIGAEGEGSTRLKRLEGSHSSRVRFIDVYRRLHSFTNFDSGLRHPVVGESESEARRTNLVPFHSGPQVRVYSLCLIHPLVGH